MINEHRTRVVVLGGGYAGVMAANHLRLRPDVGVTLINPRPRFVERIRLHQLAAGSGEAEVAYADLLGPGIELVIDQADRIDTAARQVELAAGPPVSYDYLIYAVGSGAGGRPVAGAEFAHSVDDLEQARRLADALRQTDPAAGVCVVGAGPTGIEVAAELAEAGRSVTLVCGARLGPYLAPSARRALARRLRGLGVRIVEGPGGTVTAVEPGAVTLDDRRRLASAVTVWTAGFGVPDLASRSGLRTDPIGRLLTDETLTSVDDERIVAAGDAAAPSGAPLRMSCQAALPLGAQAANTVLARIAGDSPAPIDQAFTGQCLSVGRRAGIIQAARKDDTAIGLYLGGRTAALAKEAVCRSTLAALRREARRPGSAFWFTGGRRVTAETVGSS